MIRVFPRRTKWTPTDELSFFGDPPLFRPSVQPVAVSCTFTWDIEESERLKRSWERFYPDVSVGGPAYNDRGSEFVPGRFVKDGVTITSRGCSKNCDWCLVPEREGWIRELGVYSGSNVADNNLLACSRMHIESVFNMLQKQREPIRFSGGIDAELLQQWHVDWLKAINLKFVWLSCDYPGAVSNIEKAADLLSDFSIEKKRCYVLIGFKGEEIKAAEKRLKTVYQLGFLPFAMLYRSRETVKDINWSEDWKNLQRKWCRPAAYRGHKEIQLDIQEESALQYPGMSMLGLR